MATTSTIGAVREALVNTIASALPGVKVVDGVPPDSLAKERTLVFLGNQTIDTDHPVSMAGRKSRDERYDIDLVIVCRLTRGTTRAVIDHALAVYATVESTIADDVTLGDLDGVEHVTLTGSGSMEPGQGTEGPLCVIRKNVRVVARLN